MPYLKFRVPATLTLIDKKRAPEVLFFWAIYRGHMAGSAGTMEVDLGTTFTSE